MFVRNTVFQSGFQRPARVGDGFMANPLITTQSADSNQTLTTAAILGGVYQRSGMTAGRSDTTDTAALILAAMPDMDIGDTYVFAISVTVAFALTLLAGTGVTLAGYTSVPASGFRLFVLTKTSATTVTITGL
jgi:hypothetical protein